MIWIKAYANAGTTVECAADDAIRTAQIAHCGIDLNVGGLSLLIRPDTTTEDATAAYKDALAARDVSRVGNAVAIFRKPPGPPNPPRPEKRNEWA